MKNRQLKINYIAEKEIAKGNINLKVWIVGTFIFQPKISQLIRDNTKHQKNSKRWWEMVDKLTDRVKSVTYLSSIFDVNDINKHFQAINTNPSNFEPNLLEIPLDCKPPQFHESTVCKQFQNSKGLQLVLVIVK